MDFGLDHALILHDDLVAALSVLKRLGFSATPTGRHGRGLGTANTTVMMPDRQTYFEVLVVAQPTEKNIDKQASLKTHGRHLFGLALKGDAETAADQFAALGVAEGSAFDFARPVELPGGSREARFKVAQMRSGSLPGVYSFVCEHLTPDVVWRADCLEHRNSARSLLGAWGIAADLGALAEHWRSLFGGSVAVSTDELHITTGTASIRYVTPKRWADKFNETPQRADPHLRALEVGVRSTTVLEEVLSAADVSWDVLDGLHRVEDRYGLGTSLFFREG